MIMISKQDIENNIDRWVFEKIDTNFKFRPFQKDTIIDIIYVQQSYIIIYKSSYRSFNISAY